MDPLTIALAAIGVSASVVSSLIAKVLTQEKKDQTKKEKTTILLKLPDGATKTVHLPPDYHSEDVEREVQKVLSEK